MDAEGEFLRPRSHFNWEKTAKRIEMALHTITPQPGWYCLDSGSNTFIVNHFILQFRNLRKVKEITVGTATPTGNLVVTQAYDVGEISGVRLCEDATASLLPPEIINNCGVSVHLFKTEERGNGSHVCMLTANEKHIGGGDVEFNYYARRQNKLFWLNETQFSDLAF